MHTYTNTLFLSHTHTQFFDELKDDVMLNYPRTDVLMTTARIALFFTLLCSYPVLLHPTRAAINRLVIYGYQIVLGWVRGSRGRVGSGEVVNREGWESEGEMGNRDTEEKKPLLKKTAKNSTDVKVSLYTHTDTQNTHTHIHTYRSRCQSGSVRHGYSSPSHSSVPATSPMYVYTLVCQHNTQCCNTHTHICSV